MYSITLVVWGLVLLMSGLARAQERGVSNAVPGLITNGPVVYRLGFKQVPPGKDAFDHFLPESLNYDVWTNLLARTNSKVTTLWSIREHSPGWPGKPPIVKWDTNCLIWGMRGMTAISPCWQDEGGTGQCPITALTRRHGYTRGHGMGPEGFTKIRDGRKIWFVSTNNEVIEVSVKGMFVRLHGEARDETADYSIVLFNKDLPPSIEPMQVVQSAQLLTRFPLRYPASRFLLETEQGGHVSLQLPGFALATYKGGDSGSPDLLPLGNDLVFTGGRTTSGPTRTMQNDMDLLCRNAGIKPDKYQMQWVDLSAYPAY